jgi:3-oxoadipate enol-lactonase/4-carboxymuconolactone decarboxylase
LVPSLGTTARVWDPVVTAVAVRSPQVRIIRMDLPGHGQAPPASDFCLEDLADAAVEGLGEGGISDAVLIAGLSMGGAVALEVARRIPDRLVGFAMFSSSARFGSAAEWARLIAMVERDGTAALRSSSAVGWFSPTAQDADYAQSILAEIADVDDASYVACCHALATYRGDHHLDRIRAPALLVGAPDDTATPPGPLCDLARQLPLGRYAQFQRGRHLAAIESADETATMLIALLTEAADRGGDR